MRSEKKFAVALCAIAVGIAAAAPGATSGAADHQKANPTAIISSYLGPLGLRADFNRYLKSTGAGKSESEFVDAFIAFAYERDLELPEGIGGNDLPT